MTKFPINLILFPTILGLLGGSGWHFYKALYPDPGRGVGARQGRRPIGFCREGVFGPRYRVEALVPRVRESGAISVSDAVRAQGAVTTGLVGGQVEERQRRGRPQGGRLWPRSSDSGD